MATSGTEKRQRVKTLSIRLTAEELTQIADKANANGLAVAAYVRTATLGAPGPRTYRKPPADKAELRRLLGEVNRVGNNVNQIARGLNYGQGVDLPTLTEALSDINAIRGALYKALGLHPQAAP